MPSSSCSAQMYLYVPASVKVMRKRVLPGGACGTPTWFSGDATIKPECTLSPCELILACNTPSASRVKGTLPDGGMGFAGSTPKVIVCGNAGSRLVHSIVSPL